MSKKLLAVSVLLAVLLFSRTSFACAGSRMIRTNLAHVNTWAFLRAFGQLHTNFCHADELTVGDLPINSDRVSMGVPRLMYVYGLVTQLDGVFTNSLLATRTFSKDETLEVLTGLLTERELYLDELANQIDRLYLFRGE